MKREYQAHGIQLFLAPEHRAALIQFMAKKGLGQEYAALNLLNKAVYQEQLITKEVYEVYNYRYSRKLVNDNLEAKMSLEMRQEKQRIEDMTRKFKMVVDQWGDHPDPLWRQRWLKVAEEWKDRVPTAQLIIELGAKQ